MEYVGTTNSIYLNYHIQSELLQNKIFYLPIAEIYFFICATKRHWKQFLPVSHHPWELLFPSIAC